MSHCLILEVRGFSDISASEMEPRVPAVRIEIGQRRR